MEFLHPPPPRRLPHAAHRSLIDRHPSPLDEHLQCSRFPTSSDRFGWPLSFTPEPVPDDSRTATRYDPLGSLAQDEGALARKALCSSFAPRFFPCTVSRGVLSDGTWTTEHPSVHAFLQSPSSRPSLESRTSAAIYSLAALHVFYSPSHPFYEAFWHPNIKEGTAVFVHQVITMKPSPISTAPMTWLGVHDMLWQLTGIQKEYFKSQGVKPSPPPLVPTRRSLRKRKPVQALIQELNAREPSEGPEAPPRKKSKTTKSDETEKGSEPNSPTTLDQPVEASTEVKAGPSEPSSCMKSSPPEMRGHADATPSPLTVTSSLPPESHSPAKDDVTPTAGTSSRGRTKDAAGGNKKAPVVNHPAPAPSRPSARRAAARERSPSFSSGSSTAVSAAGSHSKRARSSSSASSTITTVEADKPGTSVGKDKGKEKAEALAGEETDEKEEDNDDDDHDNDNGDEDKVRKRPIRTRRRSTAATRETVLPKPSSRKPAGTTVSQSPAEIDKLTAASAPPPPPPPPRRVRNRSGVTSSRSRKSRKS